MTDDLWALSWGLCICNIHSGVNIHSLTWMDLQRLNNAGQQVLRVCHVPSISASARMVASSVVSNATIVVSNCSGPGQCTQSTGEGWGGPAGHSGPGYRWRRPRASTVDLQLQDRPVWECTHAYHVNITAIMNLLNVLGHHVLVLCPAQYEFCHWRIQVWLAWFLLLSWALDGFSTFNTRTLPSSPFTKVLVESNTSTNLLYHGQMTNWSVQFRCRLKHKN